MSFYRLWSWTAGLALIASVAASAGEFDLLLEECHRHYEAENYENAAEVAARLSEVADKNNSIQLCWAFGWKSRIEVKLGELQKAKGHYRDLVAELKAGIPDFHNKRKTLKQDWMQGKASLLWLVQPLADALEGEIAIAAAKEMLDAMTKARAAKRHGHVARISEDLEKESQLAEKCFRRALAVNDIVSKPFGFLTVPCPQCGFKNPQPPQVFVPCNGCGGRIILNLPLPQPVAKKQDEGERNEFRAECYEGIGEANELRAKKVLAIPYYREAVDLYEGVEWCRVRAQQLERRIKQLEKSLDEDDERAVENDADET